MNFKQPAFLVLSGAVIFDLLIGEPPESVHPVVWMGRLVEQLKSYMKSLQNDILAGFILTLTLVGLSGGLSYLAYLGVDKLWQTGGLLVSVYLLKSTFSLRALISEGKRISKEIELDAESARSQLPVLVGRNPSKLTKAEMRSAVIESVFENLVDSLVSPVFFFLVGLPFGAGVAVSLALSYKAVNTLDSMIGYNTRQLCKFGRSAAKLDDLLNFIPARLTAVLLSLTDFSSRGIKYALKYHSHPSSPNSGWPMSAAAGILQLQLRKPDHYILGEEFELPRPDDIEKSIRLACRFGSLITVLSLTTTLTTGVYL